MKTFNISCIKWLWLSERLLFNANWGISRLYLSRSYSYLAGHQVQKVLGTIRFCPVNQKSAQSWFSRYMCWWNEYRIIMWFDLQLSFYLRLVCCTYIMYPCIKELLYFTSVYTLTADCNHILLLVWPLYCLSFDLQLLNSLLALVYIIYEMNYC